MRSVVAVVLLLCAATPSSAQRPDPLFLGLLRSDGVVLPYAAYNAQQWQALPYDSIPRELRYVDGWRLALSDGSLHQVIAGSLVHFVDGDTFYEAWGQLTGFHPRPSEYRSFPVGRIGFALSGPAETVHMISVLDPEVHRRIASLVVAELNLRDTITHSYTSGERLDREEVLRTPVQLQVLERTSAPVLGGYLYHIGAERHLPSCEMRAFEALIHEVDGEFRLIRQRLEAADCDGKGRTALRVFGVVPLDGRSYIPAEEYGWEHSERLLLELTPQGISEVLRIQGE